jgi:hypothetical protein
MRHVPPCSPTAGDAELLAPALIALEGKQSPPCCLQIDLPAVRTLPASLAELRATMRLRSVRHNCWGLSYHSKSATVTSGLAGGHRHICCSRVCPALVTPHLQEQGPTSFGDARDYRRAKRLGIWESTHCSVLDIRKGDFS